MWEGSGLGLHRQTGLKGHKRSSKWSHVSAKHDHCHKIKEKRQRETLQNIPLLTN